MKRRSGAMYIDLASIQGGLAWLLYDSGHPSVSLVLGGFGVINYILGLLETLQRRARDAP